MIIAVIGSLIASEGLWPIDTESSQLPLKSLGFQTNPIQYSNSVFKYQGCTAFFLGDEGLMLTNQHCIKDLLSQKYPHVLKNGFAAPSPEEAIEWPIPIHVDGHEFNISLIFVPPEELAFWGGENLNWQWPRYSADFAIFQVFDHNGKEKKSVEGLKIGAAPRAKDPVMVLGYPAQTNRHAGVDDFNADIKEIIWEYNLQLDWLNELHKTNVDASNQIIVDTRIKLLSQTDAREVQKSKSADAEFIVNQCDDGTDLQLKYLSYLKWSCAYLEMLLSLLNGEEPPQDLSVVQPKTELTLLRTTISHDPMATRSRRWKRNVASMLDSLTELPPINQTEIEEWQNHPEKMKESPFGSFAHLIHMEERTLLNQKVQAGCLAHNTKIPYPDANGTLRSSFGLIESEDPHPTFTFAKDLEEKTTVSKVPVNFASSADISRGSSGSPTLNSHGELVGIVFDMNTRALLSDWQYQNTGRTIHVDVRYVLWTLEESPSKWVVPLLDATRP